MREGFNNVKPQCMMLLQSQEAKKERQHDGRWSSWSFCLRREFHCKKIGLSICDVSIHTYAKECKKNASRKCKEGQRVWGWEVGAKGFECCCPFSTVFFFFVHHCEEEDELHQTEMGCVVEPGKKSTQQKIQLWALSSCCCCSYPRVSSSSSSQQGNWFSSSKQAI